MSLVKEVTRRQLKITESGRSTDFIAPSFGHGCLFNCSYCYMKRHRPTGLQIAKNVDDVLDAIGKHYHSLSPAKWIINNKPNQTHESRITYDIGTNEDLALHAKYYDLQKIFDYPKGKAMMFSFATKYVNYDLLHHISVHSSRTRIRFSLMPQKYADILEPNTSPIEERISAINDFIRRGYDVHINFSPVIVTDTWLEDYRDLFMLVDKIVYARYKREKGIKSEVIFLTHNEKKHEYNLANNIPGEDLLWRPDIQENKISSNGQLNIRYEHKLKADYIYQFRALHELLIPWNTIRYIF
jgi:spore photoproduct lyase